MVKEQKLGAKISGMTFSAIVFGRLVWPGGSGGGGGIEIKAESLSEPEGCAESKEQLFWNIRTTHFKKNAVIHTHIKGMILLILVL